MGSAQIRRNKYSVIYNIKWARRDGWFTHVPPRSALCYTDHPLVGSSSRRRSWPGLSRWRVRGQGRCCGSYLNGGRGGVWKEPGRGAGVRWIIVNITCYFLLVTKQLKHSAVDEHVPWYCSASEKSTPEQSQYNNKVRQFRAVYEFVVVHQRCGEHLAHP